MKIYYTDKAAKQLADLPRAVQKRIVHKMRFYAEQKDPLKFAERLIDYNEGDFRFRIGDYRLNFDVKDNTIYVLKVARRDKAYK